MSDDDKTKTDEPASDAKDEEAAAEPEAEVTADAEEKPAEVEIAEEPKEEVAKDEPQPAAESAGVDQQGRTLYNVKCSNCGKDTQVPFKPSGDRPVYCRDCYMQKKNG